MSGKAELSPSMPGGFPEAEEKKPNSEPKEIDSSTVEARRELLSELMDDVEAKEGDMWFVILQSYIHDILNLPVETFEELKLQVGPITNTSIVYENGFMYPEDKEPMNTRSVSPEVFQKLVDWFGIHGEPITRSIIINPTTSKKEIERFPPYFHVHTLSKGNTSRANQSHTHNGVYLSRTRTFNDLFDAIRVNIFKAPVRQKSTSFRVWFIPSDNADELPYSISLFTFINDIRKKHLLRQNFYGFTLKSQGIVLPSYHVLVEAYDKSIKGYPIDNYFDSLDFSTFEFRAVIESGGNLGLANLGNTCYMNSALQCLLHVPEINYYFFYNIFEKELNRTNPLGNKGQIAVAFGSLLHKLFDNLKNTNLSFVSPRDFKFTIGHYSSMFHGYQQQDSQEFLSWLLDALHEDLNRIYNKPYCEKPELKDDEVNDPNAIAILANTCWDQHKKRNDSVIVDLFTGLYQSTLVCPDCSKTSITFDPFNDLTLPLPINKKWYHTFTIVNLSDSASSVASPIMKLEVELDKTSNFDELLKYLGDFLKVPQQYIFLFEIFNNFFYKDFQAKYNKLKFFPTSEIIADSDDILVYIVPHDPELDIIVPVINTVSDEDKSYNIANPFGVPLFVVLNKEEDINSFGTIRMKIEQVVKILSKIEIDDGYNNLKSNRKYHKSTSFPLLTKKSSNEDIVMDENLEKSNNNINNITDDEYDSDISFANPEISASSGFEIKHYCETAPTSRSFNKYSYNYEDTEKSADSVLNIPNLRPNFNNLPRLADDLPQLKQTYYHYPEFIKILNNEMDPETDFDEKVKNEDDYVVIENKSDNDTETSVVKDTPQESSDEDLDNDNGPEQIGSLFDSVSDLQSQPNVKTNISKSDNHPNLIRNNSTLVCEWDYEVFTKFFQDPEFQNWTNLSYIPNVQLESNKKRLEQQQNSTVSLYDCLSSFSTPEILGDQDLWYCPKCKDHKQASKTIQIWSTGDLLTIHLKRFQSARSFSDKINMVVDFPIEGLDMTSFVSNKEHDGSGLIYDLIAVDNHYGGLGGGHYTASAKNFRDNQWYYFNDGRVTRINEASECVTGAAYLLFYRKRKSAAEFLGGDKLQTVIHEGQNLFEQNLDDLKNSLTNLKDQVDDFKLDELTEQEETKKVKEEHESEHDQDATKGSDSSSSSGTTSSSKKSRSPINEGVTNDEFNEGHENFIRRKQRLISKNKNYNKSISIKPLNSIDGSSSNIVSPISSGSEDNLVSDNISMINSESNGEDK